MGDYIGIGVRFGSGTMGYGGDGIDRSIRFPGWEEGYFFLEFGDDGDLVAGFASGDSGDRIFVVVVIAHENSKQYIIMRTWG